MVNSTSPGPSRGAKRVLWYGYLLAAGIAAAGFGALIAAATGGSVLVHVAASGAVILAAWWVAPTLLGWAYRLARPRPRDSRTARRAGSMK
ncbi:hypothetical protein ACFY41_33185 [Streptomyces syringium]|uniref:hypothetical protein n=1 Tax=Streptomyces syringium TaxID=76729 RepID=UPI0036A90385